MNLTDDKRDEFDRTTRTETRMGILVDPKRQKGMHKAGQTIKVRAFVARYFSPLRPTTTDDMEDDV